MCSEKKLNYHIVLLRIILVNTFQQLQTKYVFESLMQNFKKNL